MNAVVVRYVQAMFNLILLSGMGNSYADTGGFFDCLLGYSKRGQDQHIASGLLMDSIRPGNLHPAFAKSGIGKYGCASTTQRPFNKICLVRK